MDAAVAHQIWNYIGQLGVDRETARDLYQEAETAIWEAATTRATSDCHSYFVKTGIGAIRHWLRDRYCMIRIPGYLHDRGQAADHVKTMVPLESDENGDELYGDEGFETQFLEAEEKKSRHEKIASLLRYLTRAEREVIVALLNNEPINEIARRRRVRVGCIYSQRTKAVQKLQQLITSNGHGVPPTFLTNFLPSDRIERSHDGTKEEGMRIERSASEVLEAVLQAGKQQAQPGQTVVATRNLHKPVAAILGVSVKSGSTLGRMVDSAMEAYPDRVRKVGPRNRPTFQIALEGSLPAEGAVPAAAAAGSKKIRRVSRRKNKRAARATATSQSTAPKPVKSESSEVEVLAAFVARLASARNPKKGPLAKTVAGLIKADLLDSVAAQLIGEGKIAIATSLLQLVPETSEE